MQNPIEIATPQVDFDTIKSFVESFAVNTNEQYLLASNELITLKQKEKIIVEHFAEMKSAAHAAWKAITTKEKSYLDRIVEFTAILKRKMLTFQNEQDRLRREREAELQREADTKAEAERKRLLANAKANERRGNEMNAQMYRDAVAQCAAPVIAVASTVPKAAGISTREVWRAEITNKQAFIAAAAANPNLSQFIQIDCVGLIRAGWRGDLAGVKFFKETVLNARG